MRGGQFYRKMNFKAQSSDLYGWKRLFLLIAVLQTKLFYTQYLRSYLGLKFCLLEKNSPKIGERDVTARWRSPGGWDPSHGYFRDSGLYPEGYGLLVTLIIMTVKGLILAEFWWKFDLFRPYISWDRGWGKSLYRFWGQLSNFALTTNLGSKVSLLLEFFQSTPVSLLLQFLVTF